MLRNDKSVGQLLKTSKSNEDTKRPSDSNLYIKKTLKKKNF